MFWCNCKNYPHYFHPHNNDELELLVGSLSLVFSAVDHQIYRCGVCQQHYRIETRNLGVLVCKETKQACKIA